MTEGLSLDNIEILQKGTPLVSVDAVIAPGEVLTLMGPSGVGKSTVLAAITGALSPDFTLKGTIRLDGEILNDRPIQDRRVGILYQEELLFPHMSVAGNLAFGLPPNIKPRKARMERILSLIHI